MNGLPTSPSLVIVLGEKEGVCAKEKIGELNPWRVVDFLPTNSVHNRLVSVLRFNQKKKWRKATAEQLHVHAHN